MAQQTAVEWLVEQLKERGYAGQFPPHLLFEQAKKMEKEQSMDLIKQTAMFMGASNFDKEIALMSFDDVYNSYFKK